MLDSGARSLITGRRCHTFSALLSLGPSLPLPYFPHPLPRTQELQTQTSEITRGTPHTQKDIPPCMGPCWGSRKCCCFLRELGAKVQPDS